MPAQTSGGYALITAIPKQDPSNPAVGQTIDRLRATLPSGSFVGGAIAETHDLQKRPCGARPPRDRRRAPPLVLPALIAF